MRQTDKYTHVQGLWSFLHIHLELPADSLHPYKLHSMHFVKIKLSTVKMVNGMPDKSAAAERENKGKELWRFLKLKITKSMSTFGKHFLEMVKVA